MRSFLALVFGCYAFIGHSQTAYFWSEIGPSWKERGVEYWKNVHGYGKKLPGQLTQSINQNYAFANNDIAIKFQRSILSANIFRDVQKSTNPTGIYPQAGDLYLDLAIELKEVSDKYPFFKKELSKFEPAAVLRLKIYSGNGKKISDSEFQQRVDYKTTIKPKLGSGITDYEKEIEEYKWICIQAFEQSLGEILIAISKESEQWKKEASDAKPDVGKFRTEIGMVFAERSNQFPTHYATLTIAESKSSFIPTPDTQRAAQTDDRPALEDPEIAHALSESLRDVKYYSLVIGVGDYLDPKVNDLENPIADARRLREVLIRDYTFNKENSILLENPTHHQIFEALDHLAQKLTAKDNLLIFYAGHGLYDEKLKTGYWLPRDAAQTSRSNWISNGSLRDYVGGISTKHTLLIADACFSGGIFKTREAFSGLTQADIQLYKLPSRKAMTSGAMKTVPDKSVFLEYLVRRLQENTRPFISSELLFSSFRTAVINNSPNGQVPQFGEIRETGDEGGDFIFMRRKK